MNKFKLIKKIKAQDIGSLVYEYEHEVTKTKHIHIEPIEAFNNESACLIVFKTPPNNSHGTPHVLEHLVLNGSKKYDVKNVFHNMSNRSSATFMNALTATDKTMYPFSTQNAKDYENLLDVYLDSVFHANLLKENYLQEGWRYEYNEENKLEYKGIVYNEMKGAFSNSMREIYRGMLNNVYKDTYYKNESGGIPKEIVKMTYEEVKNFYEEYYHPSNATVFSYGTQDIVKTQEMICESIKDFSYREIHIDKTKYLEKEETINSKEEYEIEYSEKKEDNNNHLILSWFTNDSSDELENIRFNLFAHMLYEQDSAIQQNCQKEEMLLSKFIGHLNSNKQTMYLLGLEKLNETNMQKGKDLLLKSLKEFSEQKFDKERLHSILDKMELNIKEKVSGRDPYSVSMLMKLCEIINNDEMNVEKFFNVLNKFKEIRKEIDEGKLIEGIYKKYLTEDKVKTIIARPNALLYEIQNKEELESLENINNKLSKEEKNKIIEQTKKIDDFLNNTYNYEVLPSLEIKDISVEVDKNLYVNGEINKSVLNYKSNNEISYINLYFNAPEQDFDVYSQILKKIYVDYVTEYTKINNLTENESSILRSKNIYGFDSQYMVWKNNKDNKYSAKFVFSGKNMESKSSELLETFFNSIYEISFEDTEKLKLCLMEQLRGLEDTNTFGTSLVNKMMLRDVNPLLSYEDINNQLNLKDSIKSILYNEDNLNILMESMRDYHKRVLSSNAKVLYVGPEKDLDYINKRIGKQKIKNNTFDLFNESEIGLAKQINERNEYLIKNKENYTKKRTLINGPTLVGYNYRVFPLKDNKAKTIANLLIAKEIITNNYLIPLIREKGGAYGASGLVDMEHEVMILKTYRDPELNKTYENFEISIDGVLNDNISNEDIKNAIISTIGNFNSVQNFMEKVSRSFKEDIKKNGEYRNELLKCIVDVTPESIKEVIREQINNYQDFSYHNINALKNEEGWEIIEIGKENNNKNKLKLK